MPEELLFAATSAVNFLGLVVSLWLGLYIVTRSPRRVASWLAGGTLWSLSGFFLNSLTSLHGPPGKGALPWWWGWSVALAVPLWLHLSVSLLPDEPARRRRPLVILVYLLTLSFVAMEAYTPWIFAGATVGPAIYYSAQPPGPLYPLFGLYLIAVPALALFNLYLTWNQARSPALQRQLTILLWATALAVLSAIYASLSTWLGLHTPAVVSSLSLGVGVALLGYGVARYNALIEGRAIGLDFTYTSLVIGLVIGAFLIAALVSDLVFDVPFIAFVFVIMLAIVSHSLYDWARTHLDRLFYRQQYRDLRANLRELAQTTVPGRDVQDRLQTILQTLARSLKVSRGFIALQTGETCVVVADWGVDLEGRSIPRDAIASEELTLLSSPTEISDLVRTSTGLSAGAILVIPLHAGGEQIGAVVLGEKTTGVRYSEDDLDLLEDLADTVASVVHTERLQEQSVQQINTLLNQMQEREQELRRHMREALAAQERVLVFEEADDKKAISLVEDALRNLHDYPYLGEHRLARWKIIQSHLDVEEDAFVTHLDRGKALHQVLVAAIEKLRPAGSRPSLPPREWYQYVILHDCYVQGKLTRDVMSALYISHGTFNRTRRRAIRGVTRALAEMETEAQLMSQVH